MDYMEDIRMDMHYLITEIFGLSDIKDEIQIAWRRLQDRIRHMNQLLVTEMKARKREREQLERVRKLEQDEWMAREMSLLQQIQKLKEELHIKDQEVDQAREKALEELSRKLAEQSTQIESAACSRKWVAKAWKEENIVLNKRIEKLQKANEQLRHKLKKKDCEIEKSEMKLENEKRKVEKAKKMLDDIRSKNQVANAKYKAVMTRKMEALARERQLIQLPVEEVEKAKREREDKILLAVPVLMIQKQKLMQELKQKWACLYPDVENMSKKEKKEWKKMQKEKENELKRQTKAKEKKVKEEQKALKDTKEKSKERKSFWKRMFKRKE